MTNRKNKRNLKRAFHVTVHSRVNHSDLKWRDALLVAHRVNSNHFTCCSDSFFVY